MVDIVCPNCNSLNKFSLKDEVYEGPLACWKCKSKLMLRIENGRVVYAQVIDNNEYVDQLHENHINRRYI